MTVRPGIELANLTDPGCVRERNEDYYCYFEPDDDDAFRARGRLLVVADGMGGHEGGEIASGIAVEMVRQTWSSGAGDPSELLVAALSKAHAAIQDYAREHPELAGMGTTCTAAALIGGLLYYGHVGDTRLYLIRGGAIRRVTHDHSLVQRLVDTGVITPEQAADHPDRNVLVSALGMNGAVTVDVPDAAIPSSPATRC
jgi:protein phosphatase